MISISQAERESHPQRYTVDSAAGFDDLATRSPNAFASAPLMRLHVSERQRASLQTAQRTPFLAKLYLALEASPLSRISA